MPHRSLWMQSESSRCDETPSLLWGLDPVFVAFAKLYIRDILAMKESRQVPGIFLYNGHPIKQVDILGTVIGMRERDAFYSYGVDDSTGVINCICWKKSDSAESSPAAPSSARELSVISKLEKLQEAIEQRSRIEIGDIIRIRGYIRTYREEREIHATIYYKVDDPMWNIQIARMLELPDLYRRVYDQPFHIPALEQEEASRYITLRPCPRCAGELGSSSLEAGICLGSDPEDLSTVELLTLCEPQFPQLHSEDAYQKGREFSHLHREGGTIVLGSLRGEYVCH